MKGDSITLLSSRRHSVLHGAISVLGASGTLVELMQPHDVRHADRWKRLASLDTIILTLSIASWVFHVLWDGKSLTPNPITLIDNLLDGRSL